MPLNFDTGAYANAYNQGEENRLANENRLLQLLSSLGQVGQTALGYKSLSDQNNLKKQENQTLGERYPGLFSSNALSQPVSTPNSALPEPNFSMPQQTYEQEASAGMPDIGFPAPTHVQVPNATMEQPRNLVDGFQSFLRGQQPQKAQIAPGPTAGIDTILSDPSKLRLKDYSDLSEIRKNILSNQPKVETDFYTPEQASGILKGDFSSFGNKIPKGAVQQSSLISSRDENRDLRKTEQDRNFKERRSKEKTDIVNKFNADSGVKKIQSSIDASNNIRELANSGNPIAANAIPTFMARASGEVGNLSEADKRPFGGSQAILARMEASLQQMATGELTESNRNFVNELVDIMEKRAQGNLDRRAKELSSQYSNASDYLDNEDIYQALRPSSQASGAGGGGGTKDPLGIR